MQGYWKKVVVLLAGAEIYKEMSWIQWDAGARLLEAAREEIMVRIWRKSWIVQHWTVAQGDVHWLLLVVQCLTIEMEGELKPDSGCNHRCRKPGTAGTLHNWTSA